MRSALPVVLAALVVAAPELAQACAVCTGGNSEESRSAFIWTTVFLSVLPLGAIGGGVIWLRRAMQRAQLEERRAQESGARPVAAPTR